MERYEPAKRKRRSAMPGGFRLTDEGVFYVESASDTKPLQICGYLEIAALTRNANGQCWGRLLKWRDPEGREHTWAMPMSLLSGDGGVYREHLLDGGLNIGPGRNRRDFLTVYIQTAQPLARALCVPQVGWHGGNFVLPDVTIGPEGEEPVLFQGSEFEHLLNMKGTLQQWQEHVGRLCRGNSRLIFSASCAFAGSVLKLMGAESGGVHFVGATSTGKTTALQVGGSVLGGGQNGFVRPWRATANGLEAVAELHNDLTLFLDELAQMDAREASEVAYLLANGTGKQRMTRSISARKRSTWHLIFVSAGEVTLSDHALTAGKRVRAGAEVRLLNIEADAGKGMGIFENIHGAKSAGAFARKLKSAALRFYGTPLRAWLEFLVKDPAAARKRLRTLQSEFLNEHVPPSASGEVSRAAQRFSLIAAAGELATAAGITGWNEGESTAAAARCLRSWIRNRGTKGSGDAETAIQQVRRFLEAHGASRFQMLTRGSVTSASERIVNRAGFKRSRDNETEYLILPETFKKEVCAGYDHRMVAKELDARGFLVRGQREMTIKPRLPELGTARVYCVRAAILEGDE